jgi:hypothetical protein
MTADTHPAALTRMAARRRARVALLGVAPAVGLALAIAGCGGGAPAAKPLTPFQQCVKAYEQHPKESGNAVVNSTPACQKISSHEATVTALTEALKKVKPTKAKP